MLSDYRFLVADQASDLWLPKNFSESAMTMNRASTMMKNELNSTTQSGCYDIQILVSLVRELEEIDPEMPLQRLKTLLYVSMNPGITTKELAKKTGFTEASASRNLLALGVMNPMTKRPGYNLVEAHDNMDDRRGRRYSLAPRGVRLVMKLSNLIMGSR
jgi:DNA-binding MarR family transcriptional regulator